MIQLCPNKPPCGHFWHDIEEIGDPIPTCCDEECMCGKTEADKARRKAFFDSEVDA